MSRTTSKVMSLPPILVINLKRSQERRQHMEEELGRFGVDYSFFPAVDGKRLSSEDKKKRLDRRQMVAKTGLMITDEEVGCALSHAHVYEKIVKENIAELLVLEDDIHFDDCFFEVLRARAEWLPPHWGIINFTYALSKKSFDICSEEHFSLGTLDVSVCLGGLKGQHYLAGCYLIHLRAAQRLLPYTSPLIATADTLLGDKSLHNLDSYTMYYSENHRPLVETDMFTSTVSPKSLSRHIKHRWRSLWVALPYADARKKFFMARIDGVWKHVRKGYRRLLGMSHSLILT